MKTPNRLKLTSLKFVSSVDVPAQETATARLLKRGATSPLEVKATARVAKLSDELGLVFGWAITSKANGIEYIDLQGDNVVEEDLIKVAAEWMTAGGAADTMHDREQDGAAVFCMPMTAEVAKAFFGDKVGAELGTYGLMVAIKPSAEDFQKFKTGELTGFSIDGMGERTPFERTTKSKTSTMPVWTLKVAPSAVVKASLYTNEVDGHQHEVHAYEDGTFYVCYATSAGADNSHSHGIVFEGGTLTILADSGHTHELAEGQPGIAIVSPDTIVLVQSRAPSTTNPTTKTGRAANGATNSTPSNRVRTLDPQPETKPMNLRKYLALFAALAPTEQEYVTKLDDSEVEPFLGKSPAERESIFKAAASADPVVFTGELTGLTVRKSDGELARKSAEQAELQAKKNAVLADTVAKRDEEIEKSEIRKVAAELLGGMKGDDATHDLIVRSLRKSGAKAEELEKAYETLRAMRATSNVGKGAPGSTGASPHDVPVEEADAMDALEKGLLKFCKAEGIPVAKAWTEGLAKFRETDEGEALKAAVDESVA